MTSSICEPRATVTSPWPIVLTLYLWTISSSQWRCEPGRFSMVAHRHDRRGIYRCVLLRFRGRIEIDHSYGLRWSGLCCHSRHSTRGVGRCGRKRPRDGRPHSCCAGSGSTNHSSADRIVVNSYSLQTHVPLATLIMRMHVSLKLRNKYFFFVPKNSTDAHAHGTSGLTVALVKYNSRRHMCSLSVSYPIVIIFFNMTNMLYMYIRQYLRINSVWKYGYPVLIMDIWSCFATIWLLLNSFIE